jgi:acetyl esterase/lipase
VQEGRAFAEALEKASDNPVAYSEIPHAQHAFDFFGSPHGDYTATAVAHFLDWVKAKRG